MPNQTQTRGEVFVVDQNQCIQTKLSFASTKQGCKLIRGKKGAYSTRIFFKKPTLKVNFSNFSMRLGSRFTQVCTAFARVQPASVTLFGFETCEEGLQRQTEGQIVQPMQV